MNYTLLAEHVQNKLFEAEAAEDGHRYPIICDLHGAFSSSNFLYQGDNDDAHHNCLGCNYAHYTWGLLRSVEAWAKYVENTSDNPPPQLKDFYPVSVCFHWLNTLVDAKIEILKILQIDEGRTKRLFPVFQRIKKWTNFFKHPKAMVLTHHTEYVFELTPNNDADPTIMREEDIFKYYSGDKYNKELFNKLSNQKSIVVILPDLFELITEFGNATLAFISLIKDNKLFLDELGTKTTYSEFYMDEEIQETETD